METENSADPPCDLWQWADPNGPSGANAGCWVHELGWKPGVVSAAKTDWMGSSGCTRPLADWGVTFLVAFLGGGVVYFVGGAAYMRSTRQHGWTPHRFFWEEMAGLVEDGMAFARGERSDYGTVGSGPRQQA